MRALPWLITMPIVLRRCRWFSRKSNNSFASSSIPLRDLLISALLLSVLIVAWLSLSFFENGIRAAARSAPRVMEQSDNEKVLGSNDQKSANEVNH